MLYGENKFTNIHLGANNMSLESKLVLAEKVENKDRKFGSILEYYPVIVKTEDGTEVPALFNQKSN